MLYRCESSDLPDTSLWSGADKGQNEALYDICTTQLKNKSPEHKDLNALIAKVMSGFTSESCFDTRGKRSLTISHPPIVRLALRDLGRY